MCGWEVSYRKESKDSSRSSPSHWLGHSPRSHFFSFPINSVTCCVVCCRNHQTYWMYCEKCQLLCCHIYFEKCLSRPVFWEGWGCFEWRCVLITPILDKVSKTDTQLQSQDVMVPKSAPRQFLGPFVKAKVVLPLHWIRTVLTLLVTFSSKFPQFSTPVLWNVNGSRIFLNSRSFQFNYNYSLLTGRRDHWLSVWTAMLFKWHNRNIHFIITLEIWNLFNLSSQKSSKMW